MSLLHIRKKDAAVQSICDKDPIMKRLIMSIGDLKITLRGDYFEAIVRSIVGQQISVHAAEAIYGRLQDLLGGRITENGLLKESKESLRGVGLTKQKVEYVKDLAEKVQSKKLDLVNIDAYDDDSVMEQLTAVKGIGKWTAEVFLILTLGRKDVLAIDDVGIQRAAKWLYEVDKSDRRNILIEKSPLWVPNRSIASFYLWEAIHREFLTTYDSIAEVEEMDK